MNILEKIGVTLFVSAMIVALITIAALGIFMILTGQPALVFAGIMLVCGVVALAGILLVKIS